jgi:hypothetical protein
MPNASVISFVKSKGTIMVDDFHGDSATLLILDRLKSIDETMRMERQSSAVSRERIYSKLEQTDGKVDKIENRVEKLEHAITAMSPTVAEFVSYKTQVVGARKLGRVLWVTGGILLGWAAAMVGWWDSIIKFLSHR